MRYYIECGTFFWENNAPDLISAVILAFKQVCGTKKCTKYTFSKAVAIRQQGYLSNLFYKKDGQKILNMKYIEDNNIDSYVLTDLSLDIVMDPLWIVFIPTALLLDHINCEECGMSCYHNYVRT